MRVPNSGGRVENGEGVQYPIFHGQANDIMISYGAWVKFSEIIREDFFLSPSYATPAYFHCGAIFKKNQIQTKLEIQASRQRNVARGR